MMKYLAKIVMAVFFAVTVMSCQEELVEITEPANETSLKVNTKVATLIQKTAMKDGSKDNIIDGASCLEIQLPVSVIVNGLEIIIDEEADFETIEAIFDEVDFDDDLLEIIFPITIITSNYGEFVINNVEELAQYAAECVGADEIDDDIECLDFVYPIAISVYDSANQLLNTVSITNDKHFYKFIDHMEAYHIVEINFPITVVLYDGTEVVIENMEALELIIEESDGLCDEDDDCDYDDDDCDDCTQDKFMEMLFACPLKIDRLKINDDDLSDTHKYFILVFLEDGVVKITGNGEENIGEWNIETTDKGIFITVSVPNLPNFNFTWRLYEMREGRFDFRHGENRMKLRKHCNSPKYDLIGNLKDGDWIVANHTEGDTNLTEMYQGYKLDFNSDWTVTATNDTSDIEGVWEVYYDNNMLRLHLSFGDHQPMNELNNNWYFVEMNDGRVALKMMMDGSMNTTKLVLEKL